MFSGAWGDTVTGGWSPAQVVLSGGTVTLWVASPAGWAPHFTVPAGRVVVKSAAQRITLVVNGRGHPILADPGAVNRALGLTGAGIMGQARGVPGVAAASHLGRGVNQAMAARAFSANGGAQFLAAMRASGARVSRIGYGALVAIGFGITFVVVLALLVITALVLNA